MFASIAFGGYIFHSRHSFVVRGLRVHASVGFFLEGIPSCPLSVDRHFSSGERAPSRDFACYLGLRTTSSSQIIIDLSFDSYAFLRKNHMTCNPSYVLIIHNYRKLVYQTNTHSRIRILAGLLRDTIFKGKINE